jgi:hypothetical protein
VAAVPGESVAGGVQRVTAQERDERKEYGDRRDVV